MKVERVPQPPVPHFEPIVITLESAMEAVVLRLLTSDAGDARELSHKAVERANSYLSLGLSPTSEDTSRVLEALRKGLRNNGFAG